MTEEERRRRILISIKQKWAELIFDGKKDYELRKTRPKGNACGCCDVVFLCYGGEIHGMAVVNNYFVSALFERSALMKHACVSEEELIAYDPRYAWVLSCPKRFAKPVPLSYINVARPPQSWQYLTYRQAQNVARRARA